MTNHSTDTSAFSAPHKIQTGLSGAVSIHRMWENILNPRSAERLDKIGRELESISMVD